MSCPALMETFTCNWCTRQLPGFRVHRLVTNQVICDYCLDWHMHALEFLGGSDPRGCQECGKSAETIAAAGLEAPVRYFVVPKDGFLALLCAECVRPYLPKQSQLYKGTRFGSEVLNL